MIGFQIETRDSKQNKIFQVDEKNLQQGDDFLLLLDKFLKRSKISSVDLKSVKFLKGGEKLGLTSRRIIETAISVLNDAIKQNRHFSSE